MTCVLPAGNAFSFDASASVQTRCPPEMMVSRMVFQHKFWKWVFYADGTTPFSVAAARDPAPNTRNPEPGTQDPEPRTRNPGSKTQAPEPSAQDPRPTQDPGPGTQDPGPGTQNQGPGPGTQDPEPRTRTQDPIQQPRGRIDTEGILSKSQPGSSRDGGQMLALPITKQTRHRHI